MMAGEIEYENFIYENGEALFGVTGHVMIMGSSGFCRFELVCFLKILKESLDQMQYYLSRGKVTSKEFQNETHCTADFCPPRLHHIDEPPRWSGGLRHSGKMKQLNKYDGLVGQLYSTFRVFKSRPAWTVWCGRRS